MIVCCLATTKLTQTGVQAVARNHSPLKQTAFCNYAGFPVDTDCGFLVSWTEETREPSNHTRTYGPGRQLICICIPVFCIIVSFVFCIPSDSLSVGNFVQRVSFRGGVWFAIFSLARQVPYRMIMEVNRQQAVDGGAPYHHLSSLDCQ